MKDIKNDTKRGITVADLNALMFGALSTPVVKPTSIAGKAEVENKDAKESVTTASKPPATEKVAEPARQAPATRKPIDVGEMVQRIIAEVPAGDQFNQLRAKLDSIGQSASYGAPEMQRAFRADVRKVLQKELGDLDTDWKKNIERIFNGIELTSTKKDQDLVGSKTEKAEKTTIASNPPVVLKADEPAAQAPVTNKRRDFIGWGETKLPGAVTSPEEKAVQHQEGERKQAATETLEIVARGFVVGKVIGEAPQDMFPEVTVPMLRIQTLEPTPREFLISKGGAKKVEEVADGEKRMRYRWADPGGTAELEKLHDLVRGEGKLVVVRATAIERFNDSDGMNRPEWSVPSYFPADAQAEIKKIVDGAEKK